ncbi:hypothetical protein RI129_007858 [Pyrocoelia pectoralis]|uniref:Uncharacterized protein n=1 Tax=Pyrocoelia pectoralis TaxID=417401 RepID=A0AAN7VEX2_9COLE
MRSITIILILCFVAVFGDKPYEYSKIAKECITTLKLNEKEIRDLVPEVGEIPTDNEVVLKFFECCFRDFINNNGRVVENKKFKDYIRSCFEIRMTNAKHSLVKLVAKDCINQCKHIRGKSNGETGIKVMNCLKNKFQEYFEV